MIVFVRHGEVENPTESVYADLPGFDLSAEGRRQAADLAVLLSERPIAAVWSSPLLRALRTAEAVATSHRLPIRVHPDLVEWRLLSRWRGHRWLDLPSSFPGELEAYLADPTILPFSAEDLVELARRVAAVASSEVGTRGDVVIVSHQDPIQAATRLLTGAGFHAFHQDKPRHAEPIFLQPGTPWRHPA